MQPTRQSVFAPTALAADTMGSTALSPFPTQYSCARSCMCMTRPVSAACMSQQLRPLPAPPVSPHPASLLQITDLLNPAGGERVMLREDKQEGVFLEGIQWHAVASGRWGGVGWAGLGGGAGRHGQLAYQQHVTAAFPALGKWLAMGLGWVGGGLDWLAWEAGGTSHCSSTVPVVLPGLGKGYGPDPAPAQHTACNPLERG